MAIKVAPNRGIAVFLAILVKAAGLGIPRFKSTRIPSTITIALSTSIPIATIKAARETRCKVPSSKYRITKAPKTIMTRPVPIITPLRNPIVSINTRITTSTDSTRLIIKVPIASLTRSGWKNTF